MNRKSNNGALNYIIEWLNSYAAISGGTVYAPLAVKGTVGSNVTLTPVAGSSQILTSVIVNAPGADADATLKIYKDSVAGGNLLYNGYMALRDSDGRVRLNKNTACTTAWIVLVTGGSGDCFVQGEYY